MYRVYAPFLIHITEEARAMLPTSPSAAAQIIFCVVAAAGQGFDIAYVPVDIVGIPFAAASRIGLGGTVIIELDCAQPGLTPRIITGDTYRKAAARAAHRGGTVHRRIEG